MALVFSLRLFFVLFCLGFFLFICVWVFVCLFGGGWSVGFCLFLLLFFPLISTFWVWEGFLFPGSGKRLKSQPYDIMTKVPMMSLY